uniref:G-protein coupled receptors family 1 profile domain-containing protein n=1 Tax=Calidris pygmaea TaxID=425635 RepID=A0A8C3J019_9CHAR
GRASPGKGLIQPGRGAERSRPRQRGRAPQPREPGMNGSVAGPPGECVPSDPVQFLLVPAVYCLVLCVGLPGNLVALLVFLQSGKVRKAIRIYLINLTLADILFNLTLPLWIPYYLAGGDWLLSEAACRLPPAPQPQPPQPQPRLSPCSAAGACARSAPAPGAAGRCSPLPHPLPTGGGWPWWAQRSPQPHACRPPSRRAPVRGGGGGAGAGAVGGCVGGRWCFPSPGWFLPPPQPRSPALHGRERRVLHSSGGHKGRGGRWQGPGGAGCISCPPNGGLTPQHRAVLWYPPTHRCLGGKREASGGRRWGAPGDHRQGGSRALRQPRGCCAWWAGDAVGQGQVWGDGVSMCHGNRAPP